MARLDGLRRATFFDDEAKSESSINTLERRALAYVRAADVRDVAPLNTDWLPDYFVVLARRSIAEARRQLPAVAYYFRKNGQGERFPYEALLELLRETSKNAQDPLNASLNGVRVPRPAFYRARAIAGRASAETRKRYAGMAQCWEVYCRRYHINPESPSRKQFLSFLVFYAASHEYQTVSNLCNALSHYFRNAQAVDITKDPKVREFLALSAKDSAQRSKYRPLFADDLKKMIARLGDSALDIRDRIISLCIHYGTLFGRDLTRATNNVEFENDGVVLYVNDERVFIGGVDDPELDIRRWMRAWLKIIGPEPRPLIPSMVRGSWSYESISDMQVSRIVRNLAARAGVSTVHTSLALRKGFAIRVGRVEGATVTARHMRMKRTGSLSRHVSLPDLKRRNGFKKPARVATESTAAAIPA